MESNKFDKAIKEKLDKRVIEPSAGAWNNLSQRLYVETEKKTSSRNYWWLGLAASLVGVLLFVTQTVESRAIVKEEPSEVVAAPNNNLETDNTISEKQNNLIEKESGVQDALIVAENNGIEEANFKERLDSRDSDKIVTKFPEEKASTSINDNNVANMKFPEEKLTFEEQKLQEVLAQVQLLKDGSKEVSEADLDALLMKAEKEIALNRLSREISGSVDANALLESVEQELDQSFRRKVLEAIKTSYNSVKTTIAQRNE